MKNTKIEKPLGKLKKIDYKINYKKLIFIIISIGILLRFFLAILNHASGDACWYLSIARFIGENYRIPLFENLGRDSVFSRGPLFHIIAAIFYNVFGIFGTNAANLGLKMVSPLFGSLTLVLFYHLVKRYFNERITLISVLILTFLPMHIYYSSLSYTDSVLAFFALLSVFLILKDKLVLSSIFAGMAVLTKFEGLFMIPLLLIIIFYKNRKNYYAFIKKSFIFLLVSFLLYIPILVRNIIYLGNPVWPFFIQIIGGYPVLESGYVRANFLNLFNIFNLITPFLELFGVPNGEFRNLFFFNIPFIEIFVVIWLAATLVYFSFFIYGLVILDKKYLPNIFLLLWILSYVIFLILSIIFTRFPFGRYLMTSVPAIAIIWALGIDQILKIKKLKKILLIFLLLLIIGFVFTEFTKTILIAKSWQKYERDFEWVRENTGKESTIFYSGQCISYNTERFAVYPIIPATKEYILPKRLAELGESYIWVNQEFNLDPQSILPQEVLEVISNDYKLVYSNEKTKTEIYKVK